MATTGGARILGLMVASLACGDMPQSEPLGRLASAVIGGEPSTPEQDAVVLLLRGEIGVEGACTGAIVAPTLILTARHCLFELVGDEGGFTCGDEGGALPIARAWPAPSFSVFVGSERPLGDAVAVGVRSHSSDDLDACQNDTALLEVAPPLATTPLAVRLDGAPVVGERGRLVGWGATTPAPRPGDFGQIIALERQQREIEVLALGPTPYTTTNGSVRSLDALSFVGSEGGCFGDSGAPLVGESGAVIGVQMGMQPWVSTDAEGPESPCDLGLTLFHRLDRQAGWLRAAFQSAGVAPRIEGQPEPAEPGQACEQDEDCASALCVRAGADAFCSIRCDVADCPDGMECAGPERVCVPAVDRAAASCGGRASRRASIVGLLAAAFFLARRRTLRRSLRCL